MIVIFIIAQAVSALAQNDLDHGRRVALVVGNGDYTGVPFLANPVDDARLIAAKLEDLGFEVLLRANLDRRGFIRALSDFRKALADSDTGAFYYAGHGVQVGGKNFLLPVNATLDTAEFLSLEAIDLALITETINEASHTSLVFLDACRNNPFEQARGSGSSIRGLARVSADRNTIISFAAAPGNVALDRVPGVDGNHSPFTTALAKHLGTPGDTISRTMIKVRRDVLDLTKGKQVPWEHSSLVDEVVLRAAPSNPDADNVSDETMWAWVSGTADPVVLERFVERFPGSRHAAAARDRIRSLRAAEGAAGVEGGRNLGNLEIASRATEEEDARRRAFFAEPAPPEIRGTKRDCPDCPELVEIVGGELLFGTPDTFSRAQSDERPARRLALPEPLAVAITETSQAEFQRFVRETGHDWPDACLITSRDDKLPRRGSRKRDVPAGPDLPAVCVSWTDARAYTKWLSAKTGHTYRLLSEIEFEYLAEAFHFNMSMEQILAGRSMCEMANIADLGSPFSWRNFSCEDALGRGAFPVKSLQANRFGLYHLLGNVWEWMENCYLTTPEAAAERALAPGAADNRACERHSIRGGGWSDPPSSLRTSNRNWEAPDFRSDTLGFRVVRLP